MSARKLIEQIEQAGEECSYQELSTFYAPGTAIGNSHITHEHPYSST